MVSYHHVQYQKKADGPILRKLSDGRKDGRTDGQTDESDFIGRCLNNVKRPIQYSDNYSKTCGSLSQYYRDS